MVICHKLHVTAAIMLRLTSAWEQRASVDCSISRCSDLQQTLLTHLRQDTANRPNINSFRVLLERLPSAHDRSEYEKAHKA